MFLIILLFFIIPQNFLFTQQNSHLLGHFQTDLGILNLSSKENKTYFLERNILRLNFIKKLKNLKFDSSFEFNILYGEYKDLYIILPNNLTQISDKLYFLTDLRKLYITISTSKLDIYLGRQLIKFGEGIIFSVLTPFSKIDLSDIFLSKSGIDCLRSKISFLDTGYFEFLFLPKDNLKQTDFFSRLGVSVFNYDISTIMYYNNKNNIKSVGCSFKGDLMLGIYGEYVYYFRNDFNFSSYLFGADYSLYQKILLRVEFYKNDYEENIYNIVSEFISPFLSKTYLTTQIIYSASMITNIHLTYITNLDNNSNLIVFAYQYNIYQNTYLTFSVRQNYKDICGITNKEFNTTYYSFNFKIKF